MTPRKGLGIVLAFAAVMGTLTAVKMSRGSVELASTLALAGAAGSGAQVDASVVTAVPDGETATTAPFTPASAAADANPSSVIRMGSYTGLVVWADYASGASMGTDPVVYVWGLKGSTWINLQDSSATSAITLADAASTDCINGSRKATVPSKPIDALGCEAVVVTVSTAGVSAGGTIVIYASRY